jgi:hypothetical protein
MASTKGMGSADGAFDKDRIPKKAGDPTRREFTYFMLGGARFIYASSARLALIKVKMKFFFLPRQPRVSSAPIERTVTTNSRTVITNPVVCISLFKLGKNRK